MYEDSKLFTPYKIGPVTLRNRTIRASAFEGMGKDYAPTQELIDYHTAVAEGGIGMTNVAYSAACRSGLSFSTQLWLREEIIPDLRRLTDAIHSKGAKACIQIGHCGNMSHKKICGCRPLGASSGFNLYSPTLVHGMTVKEIDEVVKSFGEAVNIARKGGFDCVEIHAGHGYLISQFLSPYTNKRKDEYGGSLENRMRFMTRVIKEVMKAAGDDMGVVVKTNTRDGFKGGLEVDDCIKVAQRLEELGVHALALSGGFVSRAPMYVMRGSMPMRTLYGYMPWKSLWWLRIGIAMFGKLMIHSEPYKEGFFMEDALKFRKALKLPLILIGGMNSREIIEKALDNGFEFVSMARALVHDPAFVNKLKSGEVTRSGCRQANYCVARIYNKDMQCHENCRLSRGIKAELEHNMKKTAANAAK